MNRDFKMPFWTKMKVGIENGLHSIKVGNSGIKNKWTGLLKVDQYELEKAIKAGWHIDGIEGWILKQIGEGEILFLPKPNLVVNSGLNIALDRLFSISGPPSAVGTVGVDDGSSNPSASTSSSTAGSTNRRLVALDATATRTNQTVSSSGTFTNSNVSFIMKRLFLSKATAGTTDSAGDLIAMTNVFSIDLTSFSSWNQTFTTQLTATGS